VQFVENLLLHSVAFERCATDSVVLKAVRSALGPDVRLSLVNSRRTEPGYGNQPLHELNRRRGKPFLKCDAVWCLDEFTRLNGTRVLPGSHLADEYFLARMTDPAAPHPDERIVEAPRGSVLVFVASLIHAGNTNGNDKPRRSIQTQFVRSGEKARFDWRELPLQVRRQLPPDSWPLLGLEADGR
jgi:ectoine hydroxylase-related dioxygenase (phytanoyl-CoA dioxygenase family)